MSDAPATFHLALCPPEPSPPFEAPSEQAAVWGREWGATDEVGVLRTALVRRPRDEWSVITDDHLDPRVDMLVDPDGGWYWESTAAPDLARVHAQHAGLVAALAAEGVEVVEVPGYDPRHTKAIYTRDPLLTVAGGAVIGRLAPRMRRGEERFVTEAVAALGMPILRTIVGSGMVEGGSFCKLAPRVAAYGTSQRCNLEGARQLEETLRWLGIDLELVPLNGWSIHLDGHFAMVDPDHALVDADGLPHWFLERLSELRIEPLWLPRDEPWAVNLLCLRPGRVLMSDGNPRTVELLGAHGIEVVTIPYDEIQKGGGGVHCSTMELVRDPA